MWIQTLDDNQVHDVFGEHGKAVVAATLGDATREDPLFSQVLGDAVCQSGKQRYGGNGLAVALFIRSWSSIPWRQNQGEPSDFDKQVLRVGHYSEALSPTSSETWNAALKDAGYRSADTRLHNVWEDAFQQGWSIGGHHAGFLAAASSCELAQMPDKDLHFFLECMPWVRRGFWPCGWDDSKHLRKVF